MKLEPRPAIHTEKSLLISWVGGASGIPQGGANCASLVDGVSDMAPSCQLCGSVWGGLRKGKMASADLSVWVKAIPQPCPDTKHFSSSPHATSAFQATLPVLELRGSECVC